MTHVGDGSRPRRTIGGILLGDRIWVGQYDRGWRICQAGSWVDGYYDAEATARRALSDFSTPDVAKLVSIWSRDGQNRPVTMVDLDHLARSLPPSRTSRLRRWIRSKLTPSR